MAASLRAQLQRTLQGWKTYGQAVVKMDPLGGEPGLRPLPIFELNQPKDLEQFAIGSDSDIGGLSSVQLALLEEESTESLTNLNSLVRRGVFRGVLRTELGPDAKQTGILKRGGYAGFRTKVRKTLFGEQTWNADHHEFLRLRVRNSGDGMKYYVNIQTDGPISTDIFQHRLWLGKVDEWEDVLIPFNDFALTNKGEVMKNQFEMPRDEIRTIGISVLEKAGIYELGLEKVDCVSEIGLGLEQEEKNKKSLDRMIA